MTSFVINSNPDSLKPNIFQTVQGEGIYSGVPSFFIRLQGCNVHCHFCDEKETWIHGAKNSELMNTTSIIKVLEDINPILKRVVITGGEPAEQSLSNLITELQKHSYSVAVETSGTGDFIHELFQNYNDPIWITLSPKEAYAKNGRIKNEEVWKSCSELKFVIASKEAEEYLITHIIPSLRRAENYCPIFIVPDWFNFEENKIRVLDLCFKFPGRLRLGVQMHKYLGLE